jgi:hypothetical protein
VPSAVGGFESSSSSCFSTTGGSAICGVVVGVAVGVASLLLDRLAVTPPLPPRGALPPLGFGGIVTEVMCRVVSWLVSW